jgi:hypothetical protein
MMSAKVQMTSSSCIAPKKTAATKASRSRYFFADFVLLVFERGLTGMQR